VKDFTTRERILEALNTTDPEEKTTENCAHGQKVPAIDSEEKS